MVIICGLLKVKLLFEAILTQNPRMFGLPREGPKGYTRGAVAHLGGR